MNAKEATDLLDNLVFSQKGKHLNSLQQATIQGTLEGLTYRQISDNYCLNYPNDNYCFCYHYNECYFRRGIVFHLWILLQEVLMQAGIIGLYETEFLGTYPILNNTKLWECVSRVTQQSALSQTAHSTQHTGNC